MAMRQFRVSLFLVFGLLLMQGWSGCSKSSNVSNVSFSTVTYSGSATLSQPRAFLNAAGSGNKMLFAGGGDGQGIALKTVDVYDIAANNMDHFRIEWS
jgi:hypothetical protein